MSLECFRGSAFPKEAIRQGMENLVERFRACHRPGAGPVKFTLRIETHGSSASCVDRSPRDHETARCVATVVARHLVIPGSTPDETCG
ncbi:MAG: hypothetical protein QF464_11385, partial [Myxococcota bacterium]|nr:hypothetical protein [Myxococcota bacterium]